jgi:hypothetical protein
VSELGASAREYVARGWPVLPLWWPRADRTCACCKPGCERSVGKHPLSLPGGVPHGVAGATTDPERIRSWWSRWPHANVGIRTGRESGLVVLDVDPRNGGEDGLADLEARHGGTPETPTVETGGGGTHTYLRHPGAAEIPCCRDFGGFLGVDLKADGGYVVAPPSLHASGRTYEWNLLLHVEDVPLAVCPEALLRLALEGGSASTERVAYAAVPWDGHVPARVLEAMARGHARLRDRFDRIATGLRDTSGSGVDASLATLAALAGCTPQEVEATVRASRARAGLAPRGDTYYRATVGKAVAIAAERDMKAQVYERLLVGGIVHA